MTKNALIELEAFGQSIWLDYISRDLITSGKLKKLIQQDGLSGMTSNPSLFEKAITETHGYDNDIKKMMREGKDVNTIYENLTIQDVQTVADIFRDLYEQKEGQDGYVSLEVNPHLAHDTEGTIKEARYLWKSLARPNVFIKVPATKEGLGAIKQLTSDGINVNVTLLFGLPRYKEVAKAYLDGIEERLANKLPVKNIFSVASFFLSRIDVLVDPILQKKMAEKNEQATLAKQILGQSAIASAKIAYSIYEELFKGPNFKSFAEKGANVQRLLWASTSTKNPDYSDIKYVEPLIGPETVNTLPLETLEAYREHGHPENRIKQDINAAKNTFATLENLDIDIAKMTQQLEDEGVAKFSEAYDKLIATLKKTLATNKVQEQQ